MFHTTWRNKLLVPFIGLASLLALFPLGSASITLGQAPAPYQRLARRIATDRLGVAHPVGLAFAADTNKLLTLPAASDPAPNRLTELTLTEDPADTIDITGVTADRPNLTFDPVRKRLVLYDTAAARLTAIPRRANGRIDPSARVHFPAGRLGLQQVQGMTVDPATGRLFLLDSTGHRLIRLTPDAQGGLDGDAADRSGRVKRVNLPALGVGRVRSLAFNPANGHVYLLNPNRQTLYELSEDGQLLATRDLTAADAALVNPQGMVFAPSGDTTDDPTNMSLYIADSRLGDTLQRTGQIVELSLAAPELVALPQALLPSTLVNTIDTSQWSPPSPDPSGIAYRPSVGRLIVDDGEVEEMSIYQGRNIFESTTSGTLVTSCDTTSFSVEPVGAAVNPANDHLFFSNDDADRVYEINLGQDGVYCTADDIVTSFQTRPFGAFDPEGLAFGQGSLFIGGGEDGEVFQVRPGNNGLFDGVAPAGDDQVTQFDTTSLNQPDNEGIEYNPNTGTLYIVSNGGDNDITEVTTDGTIVNVIETSYINAQSAAGLAMAPSSTNPSMLSLYMVDRGEDNDSDPNENDGRIYEISIGLSANTPTPGPSPTPTNTPTPTSSPIPSNANFYLSVASNGVVGGINTNDEDILSFNNATFALVFDGSDVGVTGDVDASYFLDSDSILFSLEGAATIAGLGAVDDFDIIRFDATSLGTTTAGSLSLYFDGSDVGLDSSSEDIDALALLPNGQLVISTSGSPAVPGVSSATDEDLLTFTPTALGATTVGTWAMYFDGSDVGLSANNGDIDGVAVAANGDIYLSMRESFTVSSLSGDNTDVLICTPTSLGATTACTFAPTLYFDGSMVGVGDNNVDAIGLPPAPGGPTNTPTNTPTPSNTPTPTNTPTPSNTPTDTPTPTNTPTPSNTPTPTDTPTPTNTPTNTPTSTPGGPTNTPTSTPTNTPINTPTNTPVPGSDLIFADGFETGNFAAWTANKPDNGNLTVITAAALVGSSGMQAVIDDNNSFYVTDDLPNAESRYRVRFRFDPNSIVMANGDAHYIFYGYIGTSTTTLRVEFRFSAGVYQIRSGLKNDADSWITPAQWVTISDAPHAIELDWRAATAAGANNGGLTMWVDGTQQSDLTGVDNDLARIDRARMGPANSVDAGTRGTYYFDAFESRRQTYIGP